MDLDGSDKYDARRCPLSVALLTNGPDIDRSTAVVIVAAGFPYNKLMSRTLYLQVLDYDRFTRDDPIGEVCLPLCDISLAREQTFWRTLQPCKGHTVRSFAHHASVLPVYRLT